MRAKEFVESYLDAWNHGDAKSIADHLSANGTYVDMAEHTQFSRNELIKSLTDSFIHEKNHYELVGEVLSGENMSAFQYRVSSMDPETGLDRCTPLFGADFGTLRGGQAMRIDYYYDFQIKDQESPTNAMKMTYERS